MSHYNLRKGSLKCVACDKYDHISTKCEINPISWKFNKANNKKKLNFIGRRPLGVKTISEGESNPLNVHNE